MIEVLIDPLQQSKDDIIRFYNAVFLEKMKDYIVQTKSMQLD